MRIEYWQCASLASSCCDTDHPATYVEATADQPCLSCDEVPIQWNAARDTAWWAWCCEPGCLPDSEPQGPFKTQKEAQEYMNDEEDADENQRW